MLPTLAAASLLVAQVAFAAPAMSRDTLGAGSMARPALSDSSGSSLDPTAASSPLPALLALRDRWAEGGLRFGASHAADLSSATGGGTLPGAGALRGLLVVAAEADLERLLGLPGLSLRVEHHTLWGRDGSEVASTLQGWSGIDAEPFSGPGAVLLEQSLLEGRVRWLAGRMDVNAEFAASDEAGGFLSPALGLTPTMSTAPTYPDPALGAALFVAPWDAWTAGVGVHRASGVDPDERSTFLVAESRVAVGAVRVALGGWRHARPDPTAEGLDAPAGTYFLLDGTVWRSRSGSTVSAFAQLARAARPTPFGRHVAGGVVGRGLFGACGAEMGAAVTRVRSRGPEPVASEEAVEAYLALPVGPWTALQLDLQRISGGARAAGPLWVSTLRFTFDF